MINTNKNATPNYIDDQEALLNRYRNVNQATAPIVKQNYINNHNTGHRLSYEVQQKDYCLKSSSLEQLKIDKFNKYKMQNSIQNQPIQIKQNLISCIQDAPNFKMNQQDKNNSQEEFLDLEQYHIDCSEDDELVFKDQVKHNQRENSVTCLDDDYSNFRNKLEYGNNFEQRRVNLQNKQEGINNMTKQSLFTKRQQQLLPNSSFVPQQQKKLNYGNNLDSNDMNTQNVSNIQQVYYNKYFDNKQIAHQNQKDQKELLNKSLFLYNNNSKSNPVMNTIQKSSLCEKSKPVQNQIQQSDTDNQNKEIPINKLKLFKSKTKDAQIMSAVQDPVKWKEYIDRKNIQDSKNKIHNQFKDKIEKDKKQKQGQLQLQKKEKEVKKIQQEEQSKRQQKKQIDELFGTNQSESPKSRKSSITKSYHYSQKSSGAEVEISIDKLESNEEQLKVMKLEQEKQNLILQEKREQQKRQQEQEERRRKFRFSNRKNVDDLIQPIISLEIINMFSQFTTPLNSEHEFQISKNVNYNSDYFPVLPMKFENPVQYQEIWKQLNLFETFNQLINRRNESDKDSELSKMYGYKIKNDNQKKIFNGILQKGKQNQTSWSDQNYVYLHLYENELKNIKVKENQGFQQKNDKNEHLNQLKEFDLLLLSFEQLETENVKKLTSVDFLKKIQNQEGKMMGIVEKKRQLDKNFIEIKVDIKHEKYLNQCFSCKQSDSANKNDQTKTPQNTAVSTEVSNQPYIQMQEIFVYFFDSMSTRIREFRTIKNAEFYNFSHFIFDPSLLPKFQKSQLNFDINKNEDLLKSNNDYEFKNEEKETPKEQIIQKKVPAGTGKTHTIKGIISMLNYSLKNFKKILVCAPSNAAIDEIVTRLISKGGLFGQNEEESKKKVLRIGSMDYEPSKIVQQVIFDSKLNKGGQNLETPEEKENYDKQLKKWILDISLVDQIIKFLTFETKNILKIRELAQQILANKDQIDDFMKYEKKKKIEKLKMYQKEIQQKQFNLEEQRKASGKNMTKAQRKALEKKIIQNACIICTTLSMSANEKLDYLNPGDIEYLIVDEACQSVELTNLIPFEHRPQKIILVGDQQQLPATTFSENADRTNYSRSMFERFIQNGVDRVMLEIQYRMDPIIRKFPSSQFYEDRLNDDSSIYSRLEQQEFKNSNLSIIYNQFSPIQFFDITYSVEDASESSKTNLDEVEMIENLLKKFMTIIIQQKQSSDTPTSLLQDALSKQDNQKYKNLPPATDENIKQSVYRDVRQEIIQKLKGCIGIVTPYKSQVRQIKDKIFKFLRNFAEIQQPQDYIEINTVDAYQGREKDIMIFSCVRANGNLGFISDYRRMNVAITRAKHCLFVVGNSKTLNKDKNWKDLIFYCKNLQSSNQKIFYQEFLSKNDLIQTYDLKKQIQNKNEDNFKNINTERQKNNENWAVQKQNSGFSNHKDRIRSQSKKQQKNDEKKIKEKQYNNNKFSDKKDVQMKTKIDQIQNQKPLNRQSQIEEGEYLTQENQKNLSQNSNIKKYEDKKDMHQNNKIDKNMKNEIDDKNKFQKSESQRSPNKQNQYFQSIPLQKHQSNKWGNDQRIFQSKDDNGFKNEKRFKDDDFDYKSQVQYGQKIDDKTNNQNHNTPRYNFNKQDSHNDQWKKSDQNYDRQPSKKYSEDRCNNNKFTDQSIKSPRHNNGYSNAYDQNESRNNQDRRVNQQFRDNERQSNQKRHDQYPNNYQNSRNCNQYNNRYQYPNQYDREQKRYQNDQQDQERPRKREQKDQDKRSNNYNNYNKNQRKSQYSGPYNQRKYDENLTQQKYDNLRQQEIDVRQNQQ